jgi:serine/threonine-protein kinase
MGASGVSNSLKDGGSPTLPNAGGFAEVPSPRSRPDIAKERDTTADHAAPASDSEIASAATQGWEDGNPSSTGGEDGFVGKLLAERYRVLEQLGSGGMGTVYRAEHVHMRKSVALKVLHREMTHLPEVVARFEREAVAAARIEHPHVAAATDFGRLDDGAFYLVLEFVEGRSLGNLLKDTESLPVERALRVARQVADALGAAHQAGIVHRDLKPDNIMLVAREDGDDFVKVLDFGIAKLHLDDSGDQPALTRAGTVFGTPEYMAPEQAAGQAVDHRADLYTLGVLFYRLLAGRPPFRSENVTTVLAMQITHPPPPLPQTVDPEIVSIVMRLLEKNPDDRIQSARETASRLSAFLGMPAIASGTETESTPRGGSDGAPNSAQSVRPVQKESARTLLLLGLGTMAVLLSVAVLAKRGPAGDEAASPSASTEPAHSTVGDLPMAPELESLLAKAFVGNKEALQTLEGRPESIRTAREWVALARGYSKNHERRKALHACREALRKDPRLASDPQILRAVSLAVNDPDLSVDALKLAADSLGPVGADLLFDVWAGEREDKAITALAERLVRSPAVRKNASPALQSAILVREVEQCDRIEALLPRVTLHGDRRSLGPLKALRDRNECSLSPAALEAAITAAGERAGPKF